MSDALTRLDPRLIAVKERANKLGVWDISLDRTEDIDADVANYNIVLDIVEENAKFLDKVAEEW